MGQLGYRQATGALSATNKVTAGAWVVTFPTQALPSDQDFEIWHGALRGPGGYALIYIDDSLYGVAENGLINEYAPPQAMYIRKGQAVSLHWSISTGTAPTVTFWLRQPEVGRL